VIGDQHSLSGNKCGLSRHHSQNRLLVGVGDEKLADRSARASTQLRVAILPIGGVPQMVLKRSASGLFAAVVEVGPAALPACLVAAQPDGEAGDSH